jgi:hypothetical protein
MNRERQPQSNVILWNIDNLKIKFVKTGVLNPNLLLTENRQDVNFRIKFLEDIFKNKIDPEKTQYFKFVSDKDKGIRRNSKESVEDFKKLFFSIEEYGILEPILVGKFEQNKIQTRYIINQIKKWFEIENKTKYQLMDGAHRLAIAIYLEFNTIPVKIIKPSGFEIPNYTEYINIKEKEYL